jgi:hypothetical protein
MKRRSMTFEWDVLGESLVSRHKVYQNKRGVKIKGERLRVDGQSCLISWLSCSILDKQKYGVREFYCTNVQPRLGKVRSTGHRPAAVHSEVPSLRHAFSSRVDDIYIYICMRLHTHTQEHKYKHTSTHTTHLKRM